jgi:hypothetical protein
MENRAELCRAYHRVGRTRSRKQWQLTKGRKANGWRKITEEIERGLN